jgi:hypothetical protein
MGGNSRDVENLESGEVGGDEYGLSSDDADGHFTSTYWGAFKFDDRPL